MSTENEPPITIQPEDFENGEAAKNDDVDAPAEQTTEDPSLTEEQQGTSAKAKLAAQIYYDGGAHAAGK